MDTGYKKQLKFVLAIEITLIFIVVGFSYFFWHNVCDETWKSCLVPGKGSFFLFLIYSIIRPLVLTSPIILALISGETFGVFWGGLLNSIGLTISCIILYLPIKYLAKYFFDAWINDNFPAFYKFLRRQDYKFIFISRWIPVIPFDIVTIIYGLLNFRFKNVILYTFLGSLPTSFIFANIANSSPKQSLLHSTTTYLIYYTLATALPLLILEAISRRKGAGLWKSIKNTFKELINEVQSNNEILRQNEFNKDKIPIVLIYGFFSSRRALNILEKNLSALGFSVISFNQGGLFGTFFTRSIPDTAKFIDKKIKRQMDRYSLKKINIVSHSKGGLVALWLLLILGGTKYCDKLITMGSPFKGSLFTYLALFTPLGFFWKDVWEMRPGSDLIKKLHEVRVPENLKIYCFNSEKDFVSKGYNAVYEPVHNTDNIISIPINNVTHFEFLLNTDIADAIAKILKQ